MHQACEIIAKLVDDDKINGQEAVILMHAVLNNNLKTSDWFVSSNTDWWKDNALYGQQFKYNSASTITADTSNSVITTSSAY